MPTRRITYWLSLALLAAAIGVSGYLSYLKLSPGTQPACIVGGAFDCGTVLSSVYSELGGVPIAWLGLGTNGVILALLLLKPRVSFLSEYGTLLIFGVLLFAFMYSAYLVYLQAQVIRAYCPWCLTHEALIAALFVLWSAETWHQLSAD